jgi:glycerophosphoryl diester phosphodiesterase
MNLLRSETGRILVESHRGAETVAPPNSWAAILTGAEAGADLIQVDVQLAADEVPVIYHQYRLPDGAWMRATPSMALAGMDVGDGKPPPLLSEVLEWLAGQTVNLTLDVKNGFGMGVAPFARVLQEIERAGIAGKIMLAGWDHMGLLWAKRHMPALTTRALLRGNPLDLVAIAVRAEVDAIALSYDLIDQSDVEALHEVGIAVVLAELWEPNFRYAIDLGVDVVSWGDPAEAIFSLQGQGTR